MATPAAPARRGHPTLTLVGNELELRFPYDPALVSIAKDCGGRWNPYRRCWVYGARPENAQKLSRRMARLLVDETARHLLGEIERREGEVSEIKLADDADLAELAAAMPIRGTPFTHQAKAFGIATRLPASALLMAPGTGKTLATIAVAGRRFLDGQITRLLVVAPLSVLPVWGKEIRHWAAFNADVRVLTGHTDKRAEALLDWHYEDALQVAVINFDATWRLEPELFQFVKGQMMVLDESHKIKSHTANRSKTCHKLGRAAAYRMILTGTPVSQGPLDYFSQYKFLDPSIFGNSYYSFRARYATMGGYGGKQVVGYQNLDELTKKVHAVAFRVRAEDVLDLPPEVHQERVVTLGAKARRAYQRLALEAYAELEEAGTITAPLIVTKLLRLAQVTGGFATTDSGDVTAIDDAKLKALADELETTLGAGSKAIIFCRFVPEVEAISALLNKEKIGHVTLYGGTKADRGELVERFQTDPECRVFVAQIATGGIGLTLTAADTVIFYSLDYSYDNYEQAMARMQRAGQKAEQVRFVYLVAGDTVDEHVLSAIRGKRDVAASVVDNWKELLKGDGASESDGNG